MSLNDKIDKILNSLKHPVSGANLKESGIVQSVTINDGSVIILLEVNEAHANEMEPVRRELEKKAGKLLGVKSARVVMTAVRKPGTAPPPPPKPQTRKPPEPKPLEGVKRVIAVGSGKGGVGKSTTSVNLAYALQKLGLKVGFVDCDIYGPSGSVLLGTTDRPQSDADNRIIPLMKDGLASISMSNLMDADKAAVWRGPMVIKAVQQLLSGAVWDHYGELDILIADLPPGTGDVQLTMSQTINLHGAIIVSTPQDLALIDARKAYDMFERTGTKVLGLVENMSYFLCPKCGERSEIFGHGGARDTAESKGIPFLGEIPLDIEIREASDEGRSILLSDESSPLAKVYLDIAAKTMKALDLEVSSAS